jgi:hypothetical protein
MRFFRRKQRIDSIPPEVRRDLERHGELTIQTALSHPFDVPTSPLFSFRHEHKEHALAWLAEKRDAAERRTRFQRWATVIGVVIGALALTFSVISAYFARLNFNSNKPTIVLDFPRVDWDREPNKSSIHIAFRNIGTHAANEVSATVGSASIEGTSVNYMARIPPIGNPVYASQSLATNLLVQADRLNEVLLLCISYLDQADGRVFSNLEVYRLVGWPPREDQQTYSFNASSVDRETYRRFEDAHACAKLAASSDQKSPH